MRAGLAYVAAVVAVVQASTGWDDKFFSGKLPTNVYAFVEDPLEAGSLFAMTSNYPPIYQGFLYGQAGWLTTGPGGLSNTVNTAVALGNEIWAGGQFTMDWDTSTAYNYIIKRDAHGVWSTVTTAGGKEGLNGVVKAMAVCGGSLYVGGAFTGDSSNSLTLKGVAKWDATAQDWVDLGGGVSGIVNALACGPTPGSLWVGGAFPTVGSAALAAPKLAYWSGTAWAAVTDGNGSPDLVADVYVLQSDTSHGGVWVGGDMTACGAATSCNHLAFFAVSSYGSTVTGTWKILPDSASSNGFDMLVRAVHCDAGCANLYICGDFANTGGAVAMNYIAKFNWAANVISPITDGTAVGLNGACRAVTSITSGAYAGSILYGGDFSGFTGDSEALGAAVGYDGTHFFYAGRYTSNVGGGVQDPTSSYINAIVVDEATNMAYVGGESISNFGNMYGGNVGNLLSWDQATDEFVDLGFHGVAYDMAMANGKLYIAGPADAHGCSNGWVYDTAASTISCFKDAAGNDATLHGRALSIAATSTTVYLGGSWLQVGYAATNTWVHPVSVVAYTIATGAFSVLPDLNGNVGPGGEVYSLFASSTGALYAGGAFRTLSRPSANNVLAWDGTRFSAVLTGAADMVYDATYGGLGKVNAMAMINGKLHVGGLFTAGTYAFNYAVVDPATGVWSSGYTAAGGIVGFNREIRTIADDGAGGALLGGTTSFYNDAVADTVATMIHMTSAGALESNSGVGTGPSHVSGGVFCSITYSGATIFAGDFSTVYDTPVTTIASNFASWDGTKLVMPSFLTSSTATITGGVVNAMVEYQGNLVIGGTFSWAGGAYARYIAMHDGQSGSNWQSLQNPNGYSIGGYGTTIIRALAVLGTDLYAAGNFQQVGGGPGTGIARWDGSAWQRLSDASNSGSPGMDFSNWDSRHTVHSLAAYNGELYIGGRFFGAGPLGWSSGYVVGGLIKWDPVTSRFSPVGLGPGVSDATVRSLLVANNKLYIGGENIRAVASESANYIAKYSNGEWSAIAADGTAQHTHDVLADNGVDGTVNVIIDADLGSGTTLMVGGGFSNAAGSVTASHVATMSASAGGWAAFPPDPTGAGVTGVDGDVYTLAYDPTSSVVVAAGSFSHEQGGAGRAMKGMAGWSPASNGWAHVGPTTDTHFGVQGVSWSYVQTAALLPTSAGADASLFIGGYGFNQIGDTRSSGIGRLNSMAALPFAVAPSPSPSASATPSPSTSIPPSASPSPSASASASATPSPSTSIPPSASPSPSTAGGAAAASSSAVPRANVLVPYTLKSADLCGAGAAGLVDAVLDPAGSVGPALRANFATALGVSPSSAFINAVIACDGTYFPVARNAAVNAADATALRRRLGVDANNRLQITVNGQTMAVELGISIPDAIASQMSAFLQATLGGGTAAQIAAAAAALDAAIRHLSMTAPDQVPGAALTGALATIIGSSGASGVTGLVGAVSGVTSSILMPLLTALGVPSSALAGIQTDLVIDSIRVIGAPTTAAPAEEGLSRGDVAGLVVGLLILACLIIAAVVYCRKRKDSSAQKGVKQPESSKVAESGSTATAGEFSRENPMVTPATAAAPAGGAAEADSAAAPKRRGFKSLPVAL